MQVEVEGVFWDTIETPQMPFCLVSEVLDAVDMIEFLGEVLRVFDAMVVKAFDVQRVTADEAIGVAHAIRLHMPLDDRQQRGFASTGSSERTAHHRL